MGFQATCGEESTSRIVTLQIFSKQLCATRARGRSGRQRDSFSGVEKVMKTPVITVLSDSSLWKQKSDEAIRNRTIAGGRRLQADRIVDGKTSYEII